MTPKTLVERISEREILTLGVLVSSLELPADADADEAASALLVFEENYPIKVGQLRPHDPLAGFLDHRARSPITWLFEQARTEDRASELNDRLSKRSRLLGVPALRRPPETVREFVLAWLGMRLESD